MQFRFDLVRVKVHFNFVAYVEWFSFLLKTNKSLPTWCTSYIIHSTIFDVDLLAAPIRYVRGYTMLIVPLIFCVKTCLHTIYRHYSFSNPKMLCQRSIQCWLFSYCYWSNLVWKHNSNFWFDSFWFRSRL